VKVEVPAALAGERVDRVVAFLTGVPRARAAELVAGGRVCIGGRPARSRSQRVDERELVEIDLPPPGVAQQGPLADAAVPFTVVFDDAAVIVVDKPAGVVVHPGAGRPHGTLVSGLLARFPDLAGQPWPDPRRPGIVHRLDRGTSGLLIVARTVAAAGALAAQLRRRSVERSYVALVWGHVRAAAGTIDAPVGRSARDPVRITVRADGRRAVTHYEVTRRYHEPVAASLLRCRLDTGRTHQIRVHLSAIGHPVIGDDRYRRGAPAEPGLAAERPFLHADTLGFDHPTSGERRRFHAPLPGDLQGLLRVLR
jgi:23S rRNA pseudouridine1911/1915/1917 synthase